LEKVNEGEFDTIEWLEETFGYTVKQAVYKISTSNFINMKYILRLEDDKGNGANITKPCNWRLVNEVKELAKCLEMTG